MMRYKFTGNYFNNHLDGPKKPDGKRNFVDLSAHVSLYVLRMVDNLGYDADITIEIVFKGNGKPYIENWSDNWCEIVDIKSVRIINPILPPAQ